jgi:hypothetical protein
LRIRSFGGGRQCQDSPGRRALVTAHGHSHLRSGTRRPPTTQAFGARVSGLSLPQRASADHRQVSDKPSCLPPSACKSDAEGEPLGKSNARAVPASSAISTVLPPSVCLPLSPILVSSKVHGGTVRSCYNPGRAFDTGPRKPYIFGTPARGGFPSTRMVNGLQKDSRGRGFCRPFSTRFGSCCRPFPSKSSGVEFTVARRQIFLSAFHLDSKTHLILLKGIHFRMPSLLFAQVWCADAARYRSSFDFWRHAGTPTARAARHRLGVPLRLVASYGVLPGPFPFEDPLVCPAELFHCFGDVAPLR